MKIFSFLPAMLAVNLVLSSGAAEGPSAYWPGFKRVVFLGDSITYSGQYLEYLEAYAASRFPDRSIEFLNLGLPSETVSGLSEPGHAGGAFPRPDLHERLGRVLAQTKPDLIVVCYGMNDGIYYPLGEERFRKFQEGMRRLREQAMAAGAKVLHITPPPFDPVPIKGSTLPAGREEYRQPYEGYNEVLDRYSEWLIAQRASGWEVVDAHGPMNRHLAERRQQNPAYRLAGDGVHINATGHWLIARALLVHLGAPAEIAGMEEADAMVSTLPHGAEVLRLVQQRQRLLKDAWLTAVGHKRPGMSKGLPLAEAQKQSAEIGPRIRTLTAPSPGKKNS